MSMFGSAYLSVVFLCMIVYIQVTVYIYVMTFLHEHCVNMLGVILIYLMCNGHDVCISCELYNSRLST